MQEALERLEFLDEVNQEVGGSHRTKRPISSIQKENLPRKRSATPHNRR